MKLEEEAARLERIAAISRYAAGVNTDTIRYSFQIFERHLGGETILELGPAEGVMTALLAQTAKRLTLVDGSEAFCRSLATRFPDARVVHSLFEDFIPREYYDNVVLGHVLEHVDDPIEIVRRASTWLVPQGRILAAVPNSQSLHRQAAVLMGLLAQENDLNEMDRHHGHRRVFDPESFRRCFLDAGLVIDVFGGYWLKPLSNSQIEATWSRPMLDAFMKLGERYPNIAGEIYVVASRPRG